MIYGYARISTAEQKLDRQTEELKNFGVSPKNIYTDKQSGSDFLRKSYIKMLKKLRQHDLLVIKSIDRLGRNYSMIMDEWGRITKNIQADVLVLDMPLLDTREKSDTLVGKFIADIVLQILSFVAENERENIRARQAEGIAAAKKNGVVFGRPKKVYTPEFIQTANDFQQKKITLSQALGETNMTAGNFYYHLHKVT